MHSVHIALSLPGYYLASASAADAPLLVAYQLRNQARLRPWEPLRENSFYTLESTRDRLVELERQTACDMALRLFVRRAADSAIVGECNFSNIVRGPFQAAHLGFAIDGKEEGKGLMYAALEASISHVFNELKLHRIMANYQPENTRSAALLSRLGFSKEGLARRYLKINGVWADHVLTAKINEVD